MKTFFADIKTDRRWNVRSKRSTTARYELLKGDNELSVLSEIQDKIPQETFAIFFPGVILLDGWYNHINTGNNIDLIKQYSEVSWNPLGFWEQYSSNLMVFWKGNNYAKRFLKEVTLSLRRGLTLKQSVNELVLVENGRKTGFIVGGVENVLVRGRGSDGNYNIFDFSELSTADYLKVFS